MTALREFIEKLNNRERWLGMAVIAALLWVLFDSFAWQPAQKRIKTLTGQQQGLADEIRELEAVTAATRASLAADPDAALQRRRSDLRKATRQLQADIETIAGERVSTSRDTPSAIEFLLASQPRLLLNRLQKGPAEAMVDNTVKPEPGVAAVPIADVLRKHPVDIGLTGDWTNLLGFVQALAARHPDVAFESFTLKSREYPLNELSLRLSIFSYNAGLVGE